MEFAKKKKKIQSVSHLFSHSWVFFYPYWITPNNKTYLDSLVYEGFQSSVADSTSVLIVNIKT